jgi:ZIP family zinc transporter
MFEHLTALSPLAAGFIGSLVAGLGTGAGALAVFFKRQWKQEAQAIMLALAAGVMLGATLFSLILPAFEIIKTSGAGRMESGLVVAGGLALGALAIWALHANVPHEHFVKGPEGRTILNLGRNWLFILAITLHNLPEGMSVGVAYGDQPSTGLAMTIGIGLQNLPEGLAVAAALIGDGFSRARAFAIALVTGLVEPIGGLIGATAVALSDALLPWALAFAGGAMLFVISGEIIPETHQKGIENRATFSLVAGFILMMLLDLTLG